MKTAQTQIGGLTPLSDYVSGYSQRIMVSRDVIGRIGEGTTEQFKSNSDIYDERYFREAERSVVLTRVFGMFPEIDPAQFRDVLDIGCGTGNVTFPILRLAPDCLVHATDISPDMLSILANRAEAWGVANKIVAFVSDAEHVVLEPASFDLIMGSSMAHHLMDPGRFVEKILLALRPGGLCVLMEPMKAGHLLLRHFMNSISTLPELRTGIASEVVEFFRSYIFTIDCMCTLDRSRMDYSQLDDKWMFSHAFFEECAARSGAEMQFLAAVNPIEERFVGNIERLVFLGLGQEWRLPEPARSFVKRFDDALPSDVANEFASEGCIMLKKDVAGLAATSAAIASQKGARTLTPAVTSRQQP